MTRPYKCRRKMLKTVLKKHKKQLSKIAENNTARDSNGKIVITKDDVWREED